ncbi:MAG: UDP-N-acetylmuramoyl-tripeptide--D-alanyl-D-alanine ligase [Syntrophales bacterium]|nr:UDP-N-acetylmuramoyl-tripeptide--D-alanyl-D-alanine ligase [Syntrophales bacterium]
MGASFAVKEILDITGGTLISGRPDLVFDGVNIDSRKVKAGELFVAIIGKRLDGHDFVSEAILRGAAGALVQKTLSAIPREAAVIQVSDTIRAFGDLARAHRERFHKPVIAITGSSGKTTTKEMVVSILGRKWNVHSTWGNFNNLIGLPLTLLGLEKRHEACVLELGTNQEGEIARLTSIARPTIACITNIGPAHLEGLGSVAGVAKEKGALFEGLDADKIAVVNLDDPLVREQRKRLKCQVITYGRSPEALVTVKGKPELESEGVVFCLSVGNKKAQVKLATVGEHNVTNALAAAGIAYAAGIGLEDIVSGLQSLKPLPGRMEIVTLANGVHLINDVYNSNPISCIAALNTLKGLNREGRSFVVLGDMLELGQEGKERHKLIGEMLAEMAVEKAYLRGELVRYAAEGAKGRGWSDERIFFFHHPEEMLSDLIDRLSTGDWILVKGSRGMRMEEIVEGLINRMGRKREEGE